jgi:hypothetical protein
VVVKFCLPPCQMILAIDTRDIATKSSDVWLSSVKGLPDLVTALLRYFLISADEPDVFPDISHFIPDNRVSNSVLLFNKFHSTSVNPFETLGLANSQSCCWEAIMKDLTQRCKANSPVADRWAVLDKYVLGTIRHLEGMGMEKLFVSDTIHQMYDILNLHVDFEEACVTHEHSIANMMQKERKRASLSRRHDSMYRAWFLLNQVLARLNEFACLNPANEMGLRQTLLSSFLYKFGGRNKSW